MKSTFAFGLVLVILLAVQVVSRTSALAPGQGEAMSVRSVAGSDLVDLGKYYASERNRVAVPVTIPNRSALAIYHLSERDRGLGRTYTLDANQLVAYRSSEWQRTPQLAPYLDVAMGIYHRSEWNRISRPVDPGQDTLEIYHLSERERTK